MANTLSYANSVDVTDAANFIPEIWSDEVVATFKSNLVLAGLFATLDHNGKEGDTIHIPVPTRAAASAKSANNVVTLITSADGKVDVSINKHYEYSKVIEDIVGVQGKPSLRRFYTDDAGFALAKQVDSDLWSLYAGFQGGVEVIGSDGSTAWDPTANTNTGNGAALSDAGIRRMIRTLDDSDVPNSNRYLAIPPVEKESLLGLARFTEQAFVGEVGSTNSIRNGRVGNVYGVEVYVSSNSPTVLATDTSTDYRVALMFHRDAGVLVMQKAMRFQTQYKLEALGTLMVADTIYGVGELRDYAAVAAIVPA